MTELTAVCAVVVTYAADPATLDAELAAIAAQVGAVVVVDNASTPRPSVPTGVELLGLDENVGLAAAQNRGIDWARRHGFRFVLLLDQDSLPSAGMVATLLTAYESLSGHGQVAAVGPRFRDEREHSDAPFVRVRFPRSRLLSCTDGDPIECDFLISSGQLVPLDVLDDVGDMRDGLFIDNVDLEWSFRARSRGYRLFGVCAATMGHALGDERLPLVGGYRQVVHSPVRLYYIMRNRVALYRLPYTPRAWVWQDVLRVPVKFAIFALLVPPRWRNTRYMLRGLLDGIRQRSGPCPIGGRS